MAKGETTVTADVNPEVRESGLLLNIESLKDIRDVYTEVQSDQGDSDGGDSSDGND